MNKWLLLSLLWLAASVYALLRPAERTVPPFAHFDTVAHFALFFGQFWLAAKVFFSRNRALPFRWLLLLAVAWALLSEGLQAVLTTTRHAALGDVAADVLGAACALWLARQVAAARRQAAPPPSET